MKIAEAIHCANSEHLDGWTRKHAKDEIRKHLPIILSTLKFKSAVDEVLEGMDEFESSSIDTRKFVEKLTSVLEEGDYE